MANQMIALQARNPQLADPARVTAQMGQMLNTVAQQRAAERQAAQAAQEMDFAANEEARKAAMQTANIREKDLDYQIKDLKRLRNIGVAVLQSGNEDAYQSLLGMIDQTDKQFGDTLRQVAPTFNADVLKAVLMEADKYIDKTVATPVASLELSQDGMPRSVVVGGLNPEQRPVYDAPETPAAAPAPGMTAPATAAPATAAPADGQPGSLSFVIDTAVKTGVMAKSDFDKLLSIAQPQSRAKISAWVQQNNIQLVPDVPGVTDNQVRGEPAAAGAMQTTPMAYDGQTPQSQFAVYRGEPVQSQTAGLRGAPPMEQTLAQTRTSTPLQMRNPNVSPLPGSSQVPIERVRQEAIAGRESPAEAAAKAAAAARATATVETEKKAAEKLPGRKQASTLIKKVRAAYEQLDKAKAIPSETRGGFENAMDYFASSSLGREAQKMVGTKTSKYLSEIINSRKLLATAIKNATGMSAQEMNSNVELQLTLDALTDPTQGIEAARTTLDTLEDLYGAPRTAPAQGGRRTPTLQTLTPEQVRANPNIKRWKTTDGRIMTRP